MTPTEYHLTQIISKQSDTIEALEVALKAAYKVIEVQDKVMTEKGQVELTRAWQEN